MKLYEDFIITHSLKIRLHFRFGKKKGLNNSDFHRYRNKDGQFTLKPSARGVLGVALLALPT